MPTNEYADFIENINKLDTNLPSPEDKSIESVCEIYAKSKPWIEGTLAVLDKILWIPWLGTLAKVIRFLMSIADDVCKSPLSEPASAK
jgi:hypothetical protein